MHNVHQPIRSEYRYKLTIESTAIEARSITNPIEHRSHYNHNHLINLYPINSLCIDRPPTTIHTIEHSFSLVSMPFFDIHGSVPSSWLNATECWHWSHLSALLARGLLDVWPAPSQISSPARTHCPDTDTSLVPDDLLKQPPIFSSHRVNIYFVPENTKQSEAKNHGNVTTIPRYYPGLSHDNFWLCLCGQFLCLLRNTPLVFTLHFTILHLLHASLPRSTSSKVGQSCVARTSVICWGAPLPAKTLVKALRPVTIYWALYISGVFQPEHLEQGKY